MSKDSSCQKCFCCRARIDFARCDVNAFDAIGDSRNSGGVWRDQDMDVVGHDHKRMEGVLAESGFALAKRFDYCGQR